MNYDLFLREWRMINIKKVYFGQAMDNQEPINVIRNYEYVKDRLNDSNFDLISTFTLEKEAYREEESPEERAKRIVEFDLKVLKECDICLFDLSKKGWVYIGCIFEIAYAKIWNKPIIAVTENSGLDQRTFLIYHVDYFTKSLDEAINLILEKYKD